jgi:RNA polymerase sigma-70 factor (ECF subfamily)
MATEHAAGTAFRKYYMELCRYVQQKYSRAGEADDIVQDAFQNILNAGNIDSLTNPRAYLYKTAKNIALNRLRQKDCQNGIFVGIDDHELVGAPLDRQIIAEIDVRHITRVLERLPEKDRVTFLMNRMDGKSYKEISEELGITVSSIEKRMMKVLTAIRRAMDDR